jgi:hypothetical protein
MLNQIFAISIFAGLLIGGLVIGFVGYRIIKTLFPPGLFRGIAALVFFGLWVLSIASLLRAFLGAGVPDSLGPLGTYLPGKMYKILYEFLSGDAVPTISDIVAKTPASANLNASDPDSLTFGSFLFLFGFGAAAGWLWGVGSLNPKLSEHGEHVTPATPAQEWHPPHPVSSALHVANVPAVRFTVGEVVTMLRPMITILGFSLIVLIVTMVLFSNPLAPSAVQTRVASASAITPAGLITLPFNGSDGNPVQINKTVFFVGIVVIVLGTMGGMGLILALFFSWLSGEVKVAKTMANTPPKEENLLFRLIDFVLGWIGDALEFTRRSVIR